MTDRFFDRPILNSPYEYPRQHWVLDFQGQPTGDIADGLRRAEPMRSNARPPRRGATPVEAAFAWNRTPSIEVQRSDRSLASGDDLRERSESWRVRFSVDPTRAHTAEVRTDGPDGIWFIDTDDNEESFFVPHADFRGANDLYKALKTTLKAEVDEEAWSTLHSDTSRPFAKAGSGRIAVKVINHLGDEVMKVFRV